MATYQMGGITVIVSHENVVELDMSVEDALRFITTAGVVGKSMPINVLTGFLSALTQTGNPTIGTITPSPKENS